MRLQNVLRLWPLLMFVSALALGCSDDDGGAHLDTLDCEVAIVGGGAGGLHTAFRLAPALGRKLCLFEKNEDLGGRIHDVALNESDPNSPRFGTGARRVMEGQQVLFDLADELGITLDAPALGADLINARGEFSFSKDDLLERAYPGVAPDNDPERDQETYLYDSLRFQSARATATQYADFRAYIRQTLGDQEYEFLRDMSRFRADFEYPLDARGYLDYLDEEWDVCCTASYPVGGMSEFIRRMEARTTQAGGRIFKGEAVSRIDRKGARYELQTGRHRVRANKLVIAVPPAGMQYIGGEVSEAIKSQPQFQAIIGVRVVTITQWWAERWWDEIINPEQSSNNQVWRAWTTDQCLNFIEIPLDQYGVNQKATRTVYDDDARCVAFWEGLAKSGNGAIETELKVELEYLFNNGVSSPEMVVVPQPLKTHVQVWPDAWHWIRAGAPFTNAEIFAWAVEPFPGEQVALVGEAYNPQRSGWSDGAYKSSLHLLSSKYGLSQSESNPVARAATGVAAHARMSR